MEGKYRWKKIVWSTAEMTDKLFFLSHLTTGTRTFDNIFDEDLVGEDLENIFQRRTLVHGGGEGEKLRKSDN